MEGYQGNKPEVGWWEDQINAGVEYRKRWASQEEWKLWQSYYRSDYGPGVLPKNIIYMMLRMLTPRIYFRNPGISITPKKPGAEAAAVAKVMERVSNQMMIHMDVKTESKRQVQNAFFYGTGVAKFGFGAQYTPTPSDYITEQPETSKGDKVEWAGNVMDNMPWYRTVDTGNFVVPHGTDRFDNAFFTAEKIVRYTDDVITDPRLDHTKELADKATRYKDTMGLYEVISTDPRNTVELWEVRDKRTGKVFIICPTLTDKVLYYESDELQIDNGVPYFPLIFNPDNEVFWGVPDIKILEPFQREINEIKTQMMHHRRLSVVKFIVEKGAINEDEASKLLDENGPGLVRVMNMAGIKNIEVAPIPDSLLKAEDRVMTDVREILGLSRNEVGSFGEGSADRTATEVQAIREAASIREDERRDVIADAHVSMVRLMHEVIYRHWSEEQVIQVIGPAQLPVWVRFIGKELAGYKFFIKIDPDSAVAETRRVREERATRTYQLLSNNPLIDSAKLTRYLLDNQVGVQFDDMLQEQQPGASAQNPLNMNQFAQQFQQAA
jgi:hypothetical protein